MGSIAEATAVLRAGGLVAFPTETVYGLGGRADDPAAVAAIYRLKGRPSSNPLIVHLHSLTQARALVHWSSTAEQLATAFWPGPMTLVLPLRAGHGLAPAATAGLETVALRLPSHPLARALLEQCALPIAAPSANRSGRVSPTTAAHVREEFGRDLLLLDGGACQAGLESSIIDLSGDAPRLLRPGPLTVTQLAATLGQSLAALNPTCDSPAARPSAPGQLASHYAPNKPVRLNEANRPTIGFGAYPGHLTLSASGDLDEAAQRLFACLRLADALDLAEITVAPIPETGVGQAINDRLRRAAAPRPPGLALSEDPNDA